jgi:hypothetical protein
MTSSGIGNITGSGDYDRDIRAELESQFEQDHVDATISSSSISNNGATRQIGEDLAKTPPTGGMSLINQLNSTLEELGINKTGEFKTSNNELKFIVNQAYLEENGFLIVQKDLLKLNQKIQENPNLHEHILNYKVEIDPTRNVVKFKPSAEFKYAPEIVNIRNIRRESSGKNIFEDYPVNTLIPILIGPPPLDYLRKTNGEKSNKFAGIEDSAFEALEKAAKKEDQYKIDFHVAHALNIAMLPNGQWSIIDDRDVLNKMRLTTTKFKQLLSPEIVVNTGDIQKLRKNEGPAKFLLDTPFTPPTIREILSLPTNIKPYTHAAPFGKRVTLTEDRIPLAPEALQDHLKAAGLHHFLQYYLQYNELVKDGKIKEEDMPQRDHGMLARPNPDQDYLIPQLPPKQQS